MWIKTIQDRRVESRAARRILYVELLTLLTSRRVYMQTAILDPTATVPGVPNERIDTLNATLLIDATDAVKKRASACFAALNRFQVSRSLDVPVDVGPDGLYHHRYDQVTGQPEETRKMLMRVSLATISDEYGKAVGALAAQIRREVHGS